MPVALCVNANPLRQYKVETWKLLLLYYSFSPEMFLKEVVMQCLCAVFYPLLQAALFVSIHMQWICWYCMICRRAREVKMPALFGRSCVCVHKRGQNLIFFFSILLRQCFIMRNYEQHYSRTSFTNWLVRSPLYLQRENWANSVCICDFRTYSSIDPLLYVTFLEACLEITVSLNMYDTNVWKTLQVTTEFSSATL